MDNLFEVNYKRLPTTSVRMKLAFDIEAEVRNQDDCKMFIKDIANFVANHKIVASANITLSEFVKEDANNS